jgi:5-dehydro-2-deoxygluconokinase
MDPVHLDAHGEGPADTPAALGSTAGSALQAVVMGRVGADLYPAPDQLRKALREIDNYDRFVGGFAGNVATGLARLGVSTAICSRVGPDGHGDFVRDFLAAEGVDTRWLVTDSRFLTPLTFCEIWPPDRFPLTFYREPTAPDWQIRMEDIDMEEMSRIPLLYATGTALAHSPSRETTIEAMRAHRGTKIFDLDYRPVLWPDLAEYAPRTQEACRLADIVIGNDDELAGATGASSESEAVRKLFALGPRLVVAKRGDRGVAVHDPVGTAEVAGIQVQVVNGLGAGDGFAAAFGHGILRGLEPAEAARLGNASGAMVAMKIPCAAAMPTEPELSAFLSSRGGA